MTRAVAAGFAALLLAGAAAAWVVLDEDPPDAGAVPIGHLADFPPGSVSLVEVETPFAATLRVENPTAGMPATPLQDLVPLVVVGTADGPVVLLPRSPFRGCRVVPVDRAAALEFDARLVPEQFDGGFLDPCHGGLYGRDGRHLAGPGRRGLDGYPVTELPDGTLTVDFTRPVAGRRQ